MPSRAKSGLNIGIAQKGGGEIRPHPNMLELFLVAFYLGNMLRVGLGQEHAKSVWYFSLDLKYLQTLP